MQNIVAQIIHNTFEQVRRKANSDIAISIAFRMQNDAWYETLHLMLHAPGSYGYTGIYTFRSYLPHSEEQETRAADPVVCHYYHDSYTSSALADVLCSIRENIIYIDDLFRDTWFKVYEGTDLSKDSDLLQKLKQARVEYRRW